MPRKGQTVSAAARRRISEGQIKRYQRERAQWVAEPDKKRCSKCKRTKLVGAFSVERRKLGDGSISVRPLSWCKRCKADDAQARRDRKRAEGVDMAALQRKYNQRRDKERTRAYDREWSMARRREEGRPQRGPWKKYRGRKEGTRSRANLPVGPLARLLAAESKLRAPGAVAAATGLSERRLSAIIREEHPTTTLRVVDAVLTGLGLPEALPLLYPDVSVGYHVIPAKA